MTNRGIQYSGMTSLPSTGSDANSSPLIIENYEQWRDPASSAATVWTWRPPLTTPDDPTRRV